MSPYRGGPPRDDNEAPPDFKAPASSARDEAFHWMMFGSVVAAATFVAVPIASAVSFASGLLAGGIAYATHARRRAKQPSPVNGPDESGES